ncbi:MAG: ArsR family transcriptional regulator [Spirochaetae bacterium HGW-Spirochaetae-1]|jgi:DNA-binding transcriptional ArsR family regulator|nr:MAG: ArsR family transcriptional regulator [Spirochaetae bacterium HGW-Spirochaetae-1]
MAQTKKEMFQDREIALAEFARALAHPARIAILKTLALRNTCICGEIVDVLPLAQSTVSQHLGELKKAGLIHGEIEGPRSCYCINHDRLGELAEMFSNLLDELGASGKSSCCGDKK